MFMSSVEHGTKFMDEIINRFSLSFPTIWITSIIL